MIYPSLDTVCPIHVATSQLLSPEKLRENFILELGLINRKHVSPTILPLYTIITRTTWATTTRCRMRCGIELIQARLLWHLMMTGPLSISCHYQFSGFHGIPKQKEFTFWKHSTDYIAWYAALLGTLCYPLLPCWWESLFRRYCAKPLSIMSAVTKLEALLVMSITVWTHCGKIWCAMQTTRPCPVSK